LGAAAAAKISSWEAIPFAVLLMAVVCPGVYVVFKRKDWL
jgi:Mg2+ and Co2+ transporter CorA